MENDKQSIKYIDLPIPQEALENPGQEYPILLTHQADLSRNGIWYISVRRKQGYLAHLKEQIAKVKKLLKIN